ncbi:hypothetical protein ACA910_013052 [Epithemia clementina (nom. ined.)]
MQILRNSKQSIFDFATQQDPVNGAYLTMGQSARITHFHNASITNPSVCSDCVIAKLRDFVGTAFCTNKYECCLQDYTTCGGTKNGCSQNKQACSNCNGYSWLVPPNAGTCVLLFGECSTTSGSPPCCTDGVVTVTCTETVAGLFAMSTGGQII